MAWIPMVPEAKADEPLAELYAQVRDPSTGAVDNIMKIHSQSPPGLAAHLVLYRHVMRGTRTLPKVEREMIALVASQANACHY